MQHNNNGGGRQSMGGELPMIVQVALLPSRVSDKNQNDKVQNEFMAASVNRLNNAGEQLLSVAEYAKYLVEEACAEEWLMAICRRAKSKTGVVKLSYGCGYETTVVIGNADADGTPTRVSIGITINSANATVGEIERGLWIPCSESIWSHVSGQEQRMKEVSVFVRTGNRKFMIPALPKEELDKRRRMIRVWPDPTDSSALERMEELQNPQAAASAPPAIDAASSKEPPTKAPAKKAKKDKDKSSTKKRSSSVDEAAAEKPKKDKEDKTATKKRSSSTDEQAEHTKKKAKKDAAKPKAALTLETAFSRDNRKRIKQANPNADGRDVTKLVRAEIKQLTVEEKASYAPEIEADKKRYKEELILWEAKQKSEAAKEESEVAGSSSGEDGSSGSEASSSESDSDDETETAAEAPKEPVAKVTKKKKKPKRDPTKPRKGKNPFNFYLAEQQPTLQKQHPEESFKELQGRVGKSFKALSTEEKEKYVVMAKEDSEKQEKLLAEWQAKQPPKGDDTESEDESANEAAKSKKKKKAQKDPNKPKGAKTAYIFYSVENRPRLLESNPGATFAESGSLVGEAWRTLAPEEKKKYEAMAAEDKARHTREMELWEANPTGWKASAAEGAKADTDSASGDDDDSKKPAAEPASPKPKKKAKEAAAAPASPKRKHSHADESVKESHKKKSSKKKRKQSDAGESVNETPKKKSAREETDAGAEAVSKSTSKKKSSKKKKKKDKRHKSE